jgi:superfamily II DNA/RNA helicase
VRTQRGADRVAKQMVRDGIAAAAIHGDRSQAQRERALSDFSTGRVQALVATDVAARGIHVDGVACVVHFDVPADHKDFVHRSGRTGRAGSEGLVVTLVPSDQMREVKKMQRTLEMPVGITQPALDDLGPARIMPTPAPREERPQGDRPRKPRPNRGGGRPNGPSAKTGRKPYQGRRRNGGPSSSKSGRPPAKRRG